MLGKVALGTSDLPITGKKNAKTLVKIPLHLYVSLQRPHSVTDASKIRLFSGKANSPHLSHED